MGNERERIRARFALAWPLVIGAVACTFDGCSCNASTSESPDGGSEASTPENEAAPFDGAGFEEDAGNPGTDAAAPGSDGATPGMDAGSEAAATDAMPSADATPSEAGSTPDATSPDGSAAFPTTGNLILNPGAELGPGTDGTVPPASVPDWTTTGNANVVLYGSSGGFPDVSDAGPPSEGMNFFGGGPNDPVSTFTQTISLANYAADIAQGHVTFNLSGWLGGFAGQDDDATLTVYWLDAADASVIGAAGDAGAGSADAALPPGALGSAAIGPVTAAQRSNNTGFLLQTATGAVPSGTVAVEVQLVMTRYEGTNNDGFADDLSLTLTGN